jgi:hypothetical protein
VLLQTEANLVSFEEIQAMVNAAALPKLPGGLSLPSLNPIKQLSCARKFQKAQLKALPSPVSLLQGGLKLPNPLDQLKGLQAGAGDGCLPGLGGGLGGLGGLGGEGGSGGGLPNIASLLGGGGEGGSGGGLPNIASLLGGRGGAGGAGGLAGLLGGKSKGGAAASEDDSE